MADYVVDENCFKISYSAKQQEEINKIRNKYLPKEENKMEQLIRLDKQTERPGTIASIVLGIAGTLVLGFGMSCVLVWNSSIEVFIAGIIIGVLGMGMAGFAYPVYKKITVKERKKVANQILALSKELSI